MICVSEFVNWYMVSDTGVIRSKLRHAHLMCASLYSIQFSTIGELHPVDATDPTLQIAQHVKQFAFWEDSGEANNFEEMMRYWWILDFRR